MRKIGIVAAVVFVASWMFSLFCMHAAGQAGGTVKEENGSGVSGESVLDGYGPTEVERGMERNIPAASFWNATVSAPIFRWKIIFRALWSARPVRKWGWKR